jgi:hypothetical protein
MKEYAENDVKRINANLDGGADEDNPLKWNSIEGSKLRAKDPINFYYRWQ